MSTRAQYSEEIKILVMEKYPLCRTTADREKLAAECGIGSIQKLYNLASRLQATRPHSNSSREWLTADAPYNAAEDISRLYMRDALGIEWSNSDDSYLVDHFGRYTFIENIAFMLNRSETTVAYRARQLGLRQVPKFYDMKKVAPWLGVTYKDLLMMSKRGLEILPCTDARGQLTITLVSTVSLARLLLKDRLWKYLVDNRQADQFFIKDVIESMVDMQDENIDWEPNCWVSHGHTCLNPFSDARFGLFFNGRDDNMAGVELDPRDLAPSAHVERDDWRRGARMPVAVNMPVTSDEVPSDAQAKELARAGILAPPSLT